MIEKQWIKYKLLEIVNIFLVYEIILLFVKTQLEQHSLGFRDCFSTFFQFSILYFNIPLVFANVFRHSFGFQDCFSTLIRFSRFFLWHFQRSSKCKVDIMSQKNGSEKVRFREEKIFSSFFWYNMTKNVPMCCWLFWNCQKRQN